MPFEHIRIGTASPDVPNEDEDVVIVAGRREEEAASAPEQADPSTDTVGVGEAIPDPPADEPGTAVDPPAEKASEQDDGYHPTTLDDIESSKMPTAQVVVIAVALACLAAFIIWYVIF